MDAVGAREPRKSDGRAEAAEEGEIVKELLLILAEELHNEAESRIGEADSLLEREMPTAANRHATTGNLLNSLAVVARRAAERVPEGAQLRIVGPAGGEIDAALRAIVCRGEPERDGEA